MISCKDRCISFGIRKRTCALEEKDKESTESEVGEKRENGDEATESKQGEVIRHICTHSMDPGSTGRLGDGRGKRSRPIEAQSPRPPNIPHSHKEDKLGKKPGGAFLDHLLCTGL